MYLPMHAQHNFFRQTLNSGIVLNPAKAGIGNYAVRANLFTNPYLSQENQVEPNFYASADAKLVRLAKNLELNGGLVFNIQDPLPKANQMQASSTGLTIALAKYFGKRYKQYISIGAAGAYKHMNISYGWQSMYTDQYFDMDLGLLYGIAPSSQTSISAGIAFQNQRRTSDPYSNSAYGVYLPVNVLNAQLIVEHQFNDRILVQSSLLYYTSPYQYHFGNVALIEYGSVFDISLGKLHKENPHANTVVQVGMYLRNASPLTPYVGFRKKSHQLGFSYEVNLHRFLYNMRPLPLTNMEFSYRYLLLRKK
jgi:hypothetical protein